MAREVLAMQETMRGDQGGRSVVDGRRRRGRVREAGQATVEYVGLAVAVAVLLVAVGGGLSEQGDKLGSAVAKKLQSAISGS
jgi:Flp pilus assembly pilin Flp